MPRKPLPRQEYIKRGKSRQMTLIGDTPPTTSFPTHWRCDICGRELKKSLTAITHHNPCVCRAGITLKAADYEKLANKLGIQWGGVYPQTNKIKVEWIGLGGVHFRASYSELAYGFIPSRLRKYING